MANNKRIINTLLESNGLKRIVHDMVDRDSDGNMKKWAENIGIPYNDLSKAIGVMAKLAEFRGIRVYTPEQVERIRRYVETLETMIE